MRESDITIWFPEPSKVTDLQQSASYSGFLSDIINETTHVVTLYLKRRGEMGKTVDVVKMWFVNKQKCDSVENFVFFSCDLLLTSLITAFPLLLYLLFFYTVANEQYFYSHINILWLSLIRRMGELSSRSRQLCDGSFFLISSTSLCWHHYRFLMAFSRSFLQLKIECTLHFQNSRLVILRHSRRRSHSTFIYGYLPRSKHSPVLRVCCNKILAVVINNKTCSFKKRGRRKIQKSQ